MNTIQCPRCQVQLVLPDYTIPSCQCVNCNEVFEPARRRVDVLTEEAPDDLDIFDREAEILAERDRFRRSLEDECLDLYDIKKERRRRVARAAGIGFVIGCIAGVLLKIVLGRGNPKIDLEMVMVIAVLGALVGFVSVYLANTRPMRGERWSIVLSVSILLGWVGVILRLDWQATSEIHQSTIVVAVLTGLLWVFFSWLMTSGIVIIFDKSRR